MKKYTLHIIELDYHHDVLDTLIAQLDSNHFSIRCTSKKAIIDKLSSSSIAKLDQLTYWNGSNKQLKTSITDGSDLYIFNTIASNYKFWAENLPPNHIVRIHNINTWFNPWKNITIGFNFYEIRKATTYILQHQLFKLESIHLKKLKSKVRFYSFMSDLNKKYVEQNYLNLSKKAIFTIPSNWNSKIHSKHTHEIQITIPGTLEVKRKDFKIIEKLILSCNNLPFNTKIVFAGRVTNQSVNFIQLLEKIAKPNVTVVSYHRFLDVYEFDEILSNSTILFFPLIKQTRYKIFKEYYGTTKISGSENDFIKFGIPTLINDFYLIESSLVRHFNENNLESEVRQLIEDVKNNAPLYLKLKEEHHAKYNFEVQSACLNQNLIHFLEKLN